MKSLYLLMLAAFAFTQTSAQYTFSTFTEDYVPLENATLIEEYDHDDQSWDDPQFELDLGFDFPAMGGTLNALEQIGYGSELELGGPSSVLILGYLSDIIDGSTINNENPSTISYVVDGAVGDQIFKIQYANCAFYEEYDGFVSGASPILNFVNFQMWFYQIDGTVEMRFGESSFADSELVHAGDPGPTIILLAGDKSSEEFSVVISLEGDPTNPSAENIDPKSAFTHLNDNPEDGRVYQFSPTATNINSVRNTELKLWPSIADRQISVKGFDSDKITYRIFDLSGQEQMTGQITNGEKIDVSTLSEGMYLLRLDGQNTALNFVKMK